MPLTNKQKENRTRWRRKNPGYNRQYKINHQEIKRRGRVVNRSLKTQRGGACEICGYNKDMRALVWHHRNPQEKEQNLTSLVRNGCVNKMKIEIQKCALICGNCHLIIHGSQVDD